MIKVQKFNLASHKIKCLVYGESGSGKTVFGSTAPNPFWLSAEGGLASVMETNPVGIEIHSLKDLKDSLMYLKNKQFIEDGIEVDTVIIDSITEINDIIKDEIKLKKGGKDLEGKDWGKVQDEIKTILRQFRDLPLNVIFIALAKESKDEEKIDKIVPMLNGQAARDIAAYMDLVCFIGIDKTGDHYIITKGSQKYLTKDRFNKFPVDIEPNFSIMQGYIESMKISNNQTISEFENNSEENKKTENLPQPPTTNKATSLQVKEIIKAWNEMWSLSIQLYPEELDNTGEKKYTEENSESYRGVTMKSITGVNSTTLMTQDQAQLFLEKLQNKISNLQIELSERLKQEGKSEKPKSSKVKTSKKKTDTVSE